MDPRIKTILKKRKSLKHSSLPKGGDDVQAQAGPSSAEATIAVASGDGGARSKQQKAVDNKKKRQQEFQSLKVKLQEKLQLAAASAAAAAAKQEQQALQAAANLSGAADGEEKGGKGMNKNKATTKTKQNKNHRTFKKTDYKNKKNDNESDKKKAEDEKEKKLQEEIERSRHQFLEKFRLGLLPQLEDDDVEELFGALSLEDPSGHQDSKVKNPPKPSKDAVPRVIPEETVDRHPANPMAHTSKLHYIDSKTGKLIPTKMAKMGYQERRRIYADFLVPRLMLIHPALYDEIMGKMYLMPDDQIVQMIYSDYLLGRFASACIEELHKINYKLKKRNSAADCKKKKK